MCTWFGIGDPSLHLYIFGACIDSIIGIVRKFVYWCYSTQHLNGEGPHDRRRSADECGQVPALEVTLFEI